MQKNRSAHIFRAASRTGTQQLLIQILDQLHRMGNTHEELVQEFEKEIREFRDIGFQYE